MVLEEILNQFKAYLLERENSPATIQKYLTDIRTFFSFCNGFPELNKEILLDYKQWLIENYAISSANSMIANSHFLRPAGPHFPASQGHIKRSALEIGRARGAPPC